LKRTEKSQPDHDRLNSAISALEEVMTYVLPLDPHSLEPVETAL